MREAIVLAGGLGTRLRGAIGDIPKPMAPVDGIPFLHYLLGALAQQGIDRVVLSVGYRHEVIVENVGTRFASMHIDYAIEDRPLGTGGAIRQALAQTTGTHSFVLNGDTFVDVDLADMQARLEASGSRLAMAVMRVDDVGRYGALRIDRERVIGFIEKGGTGPGMINAGVYLIPHDLLDDRAPASRFSFETDFLQPEIDALAPLAFEAAGPFIDIGVPADYRAASAFFAARSSH